MTILKLVECLFLYFWVYSPMNQRELLTQFYSAFQQRDHNTMNKCYHDEATFSDPVFRNLSAKQAKAMWHMLNEAAQEFTMEFEIFNDQQVYWQPVYSFSKTGRKVHNKITATFTFKDGLIHTHQDKFNLWKWSAMALGISGQWLGWTPMVQNKIRKMANGNLQKFIQSHNEYQ